ncbi:hypothetical protein J6590_071182 [Homalodisca vitripennis]|nr:hypothetical protein J6590_071182 [Homalodisca vitripennis]
MSRVPPARHGGGEARGWRRARSSVAAIKAPVITCRTRGPIVRYIVMNAKECCRCAATAPRIVSPVFSESALFCMPDEWHSSTLHGSSISSRTPAIRSCSGRCYSSLAASRLRHLAGLGTFWLDAGL